MSMVETSNIFATQGYHPYNALNEANCGTGRQWHTHPSKSFPSSANPLTSG